MGRNEWLMIDTSIKSARGCLQRSPNPLLSMARRSALLALAPAGLVAAAVVLLISCLVCPVEAQLQNKWYASDTWMPMGTELHVRYLGIYHRAVWTNNCELVLDRNFVSYWSTDTAKYHNHVCYLAMQFDGNLVIYGDDNKPLWASNSAQPNTGNYYAEMQIDSNFVIYNENGDAIWASNTAQKLGSLSGYSDTTYDDPVTVLCHAENKTFSVPCA